MRRLLLLRHAKSTLPGSGTSDHDRRLAPRGRRAAERMGRYLHDEGLLPDLVLCSSAWRTCETTALLDLPETTELEIAHELYLATPETVLDLVHGVEDDVTTLLVVGHNPTTHELALDLAGAVDGFGSGDAVALDLLASKYPTGALAVLDVRDPWERLGPGSATLERFVTPRMLDPADGP